MTRRRPAPTPLGFHGLAFRCADPSAFAERWRKLTGLEPVRRSSREIVLGGPDLFVIARRGAADSGVVLEEVHLAVEDVAKARRDARADPLGGDSWSARIGGVALFVREFRRPPARAWRRKRRPV